MSYLPYPTEDDRNRVINIPDPNNPYPPQYPQHSQPGYPPALQQQQYYPPQPQPGFPVPYPPHSHEHNPPYSPHYQQQNTPYPPGPGSVPYPASPSSSYPQAQAYPPAPANSGHGADNLEEQMSEVNLNQGLLPHKQQLLGLGNYIGMCHF